MRGGPRAYIRSPDLADTRLDRSDHGPSANADETTRSARWAIGDDTAIRKYGERGTAEHEALPAAEEEPHGARAPAAPPARRWRVRVYSYVSHDRVASAGR
jgi:hypothetical protein